MLWIGSCPVDTKELFLKIAVSKRQIKSLKSNCEVISFITFVSCTPEIYYKQFFRKHFSRILLKNLLKILLICLFWNSKTSNNLLRRSFLIFFSLSIYRTSPCFIKIFGQLFSRNTFL